MFHARYDGRCGSCGEEILMGDEVTYDDDDVLVHDECDDSEDPGPNDDPFEY